MPTGALSLDSLHRRVCESLSTARATGGSLHESRLNPASFPGPDATGWDHLAFAVELASSAPVGQVEGSRHRRPGGIGTWQTEVVIRWLYQLDPYDAAEDYRRALAAEHAIYHALSRETGGPDSDPSLHLTLEGTASREARTAEQGPTWLLFTLPCRCIHPFALFEV